MTWHAKWSTLIKQITRVNDSQNLKKTLQKIYQADQPQIIGFVNAHAMNSIVASDGFYNALNQADILLRDGSGMAKLFQQLNIQPGLNLNGTDLIPEIIKDFQGKKIALYGTQEPYLENAKHQILLNITPNSDIVTSHGFLQSKDYVSLAQKDQPRLIVLGMGMPKQEQVAIELRNAITHPCVIVCGGAIIDFMGGKFTRAPDWMRNLGIEWLYRLFKEPKRLFKRYVIGNPLFLFRVFKYKKITRLL